MTRAGVIALLAVLAISAPAGADTPSMFGFGARAASLARAGVASDDVGAAARENAALASAPGLRVRLGYGYGAPSLQFEVERGWSEGSASAYGCGAEQPGRGAGNARPSDFIRPSGAADR